MIQNPILKGFHPDPSIVRVGDDYYIATSTFEWFPGVQIHHSRDLKHWRLLTHVLTRTTQLDMTGNPDSCGVWAPCLSYDNGVYYLIYTDVKSRLGAFKDTHNYIVTSTNIEGPWSDPIYLNSSGFDPSLFHDDDGRKWLVNMLWDYRQSNHSFGGIVLQEYDVNLRQLVGERRNIFLGTKLQFTEGPHLYKRNGYYYLMTAEGGTKYEHAVSLARSQSLEGPYEVAPNNPILTSSEQPELQLQKAGHGCIVETQNGEWAMVHLVGRPIKHETCVLGRETAIQRVTWTEDGWLELEGGGSYPRVDIQPFKLPEHPFSDEQALDNFDDEKLSIQWNSLRVPVDSSWLTLTERPGFLRLRGRESLSSLHRQSLIAKRLQALNCVIQTELEFDPDHFQQMAGLILYYDTKDYVYLRMSKDERLGKHIGIVRSVNGVWQEDIQSMISLEGILKCGLKASIHGEYANFSYSIDGERWSSIGDSINILHLCDEAPHSLRFTGTFAGLCVQDLSGQGKHADFDYFQYECKKN